MNNDEEYIDSEALYTVGSKASTIHLRATKSSNIDRPHRMT